MKVYKGGRFPNIDRWMQANGITTVKELARRADVPRSTMRSALRGKHDPIKSTIDAILHVTGMTYEEAFQEVEL